MIKIFRHIRIKFLSEYKTVNYFTYELIKYNSKKDRLFKNTYTGKWEKPYKPNEKIIVN